MEFCQINRNLFKNRQKIGPFWESFFCFQGCRIFVQLVPPKDGGQKCLQHRMLKAFGADFFDQRNWHPKMWEGLADPQPSPIGFQGLPYGSAEGGGGSSWEKKRLKLDHPSLRGGGQRLESSWLLGWIPG